MKKINLAILAFVLIFSACRKEEVSIEDPVVTTSPPVVVDGAFYSGQVFDAEGEGVFSEIDIYQSGELIGTIQTDEQGFYNTEELPLLLEEEITFAIEEELYASKYKRTKPTIELNENQNFRLQLIADSPAGSNTQFENPGSEEYVKLYGTFTEMDDTPIQNATVVIVYDPFITSEGNQGFYGLFDKTDENGYVEFLAPKNKELGYFAFPENLNNGLECYSSINVQESNDLISIFYLDDLGMLTEDTEMFERSDLSFSLKDYSIYGDFLDCDGNPVSDGEVSLRITYMANGSVQNQTFYTDEFDENGEYNFDFSVCSDVIDFQLKATTADGYKASVNLGDVNAPGFHLAPLKACEEDNGPEFLISTMNLSIGENHTFEGIKFIRPPFGPPYNYSVIGSHPDIGFVNFDIQNMEVGFNPIRQFVVDYLDQNPEPFAFNAPTEELTAVVTTIDNGIIEGFIQGSVETYGLGEQEINADFIIRYE